MYALRGRVGSLAPAEPPGEGRIAPRTPSALTLPPVPTFSIVIPVYNEAAFLPTGIPALVAELEAAGVDFTVLIVENGSSDGSAEIAQELAQGKPIEVLSLTDADYGAAMREGFMAADGEWIVNFDIDYFSGSFLQKVLALSGDADLVIASKRDPESDDRRPPIRRVATAVFNLLLRSLFGSEVSDTHGMKAFRKELVADVAPRVISRQDLFDTELVLRAERSGYRIKEVPVIVNEMRPGGSLLKRVPRTLKGLLKIRRVLSADS